MKQSYYIYNSGDLQRKDNTLRFTSYEGEKGDIPVERISDIYVMTEMTFNTAFINYISKYGIPVHFFNYYQFYTGSYYPRESLLAGQLLVKQVEHYTNPLRRILLAQRFVEAAADNIYRNLRYYNGRGKDVSGQMVEISTLRKDIPKAETIEELMGIEGNIRKNYYRAWKIIINQEIDFEKRVMHPPDNMINSLISFVNSLIYSKTLSEIYQTQLNPTISYLHQPGERRYSLALDLAEIFKPIVVDRVIFKVLNKKEIQQKHFDRKLNKCLLNTAGKKIFVKALEDRLQETIQHRSLKRSVSYRHLIKLECYKLAKHLLVMEEYKPFKMYW